MCSAVLACFPWPEDLEMGAQHANGRAALHKGDGPRIGLFCKVAREHVAERVQLRYEPQPLSQVATIAFGHLLCSPHERLQLLRLL